MELEPHSLTTPQPALGPTLKHCRAALSGGAGGFSHADQQATPALFPRNTLESGVLESYYAHLKKTWDRSDHPSLYLSWTIPQESRLTETIQQGEREKTKQTQTIIIVIIIFKS